MGETTFRNLLVAGVIFTMMFTGFYTIIGVIKTGTGTDTGDSNSNFVDSSRLSGLNNSFLVMQPTINTLNEQSEVLQESSVGNTGYATLALSFVSGAWTSIKSIFGTLAFIPTLFNSIVGEIPGLSWLIPYITVLVSIVVIFGILNFIFGRND